jgi:hypothetical protein
MVGEVPGSHDVFIDFVGFGGVWVQAWDYVLVRLPEGFGVQDQGVVILVDQLVFLL